SNTADYDTYQWEPATGVSGTVATGFTFSPATSANYVLTATSSTSGCSNVASFAVSVNPAISVTAGPAASICENASVTLGDLTTPKAYVMNSNSNVPFIDIAATGTSIGTISDDSEHNVTIPTFTYNNVAYNAVRIGVNGVIAFGTTTGDVGVANA